ADLVAHGRQGVRRRRRPGVEADLRRDRPAGAHTLQVDAAHRVLRARVGASTARGAPVPVRRRRPGRALPEAAVIHWGAPQWLWLLVTVRGIAVLLFAGAWLRRQSLARLADAALVPRLTDSRSPRWAAAKQACLLLGLAFAIVAAARPQWGEKLQVYKG